MSKIVRMPKTVRTFADRFLAQRDAWAKGKKVMLTVEVAGGVNANGDPFIAHKRVNAREVWGDPRKYVPVIQSAAVRDDK